LHYFSQKELDQKKNTYGFLAEHPERRSLLGKTVNRWEYNERKDLIEIPHKDMD
jgi:hypothetical protein